MKTEIDNLIALTNDERIEASLRKLALQELSRIQDEINLLEKQVKNIAVLDGVSIRFHCEKEGNNFGSSKQCEDCKSIEVDEY